MKWSIKIDYTKSKKIYSDIIFFLNIYKSFITFNRNSFYIMIICIYCGISRTIFKKKSAIHNFFLKKFVAAIDPKSSFDDTVYFGL